MAKIKPSRDILLVTEFRANAAQFIEQVQSTGEPVVVSHIHVTAEGRAMRLLIFARGITAPRRWFTPEGQRARTRSLIACAVCLVAFAASLILP